MFKFKFLMLVAAFGFTAIGSAFAASQEFNVPGGDLKAALDAYVKQSGIIVVYSPVGVAGAQSKGVKGAFSPDVALSHILAGTGFSEYHTAKGEVGIVHGASSLNDTLPMHIAAAPAPGAAGPALETVTVTSSKIGGDVQNIPISITALSQEQLTATQTAGGPDLVKQVPNMTFTKTNFSGYSIQLRGIGTQAISVTTDPAVAVAFNDLPFLRNHFFEQEFYDVGQVEVLRGPQGTLYGRNSTAGVVNVISAKPSDQFEAMASVDLGNYRNRRLEGMINFPIVDDRLDIRVAGEWTKRNGYTFDTTLGQDVDDRDLWSGRATIAYKPIPDLRTYLIWEHFSEDDSRLRSGKQLCKTALPPTSVDGMAVPPPGSSTGLGGALDPSAYLTQSCEAASLYSPESFGVPYGASLPFVKAAELAGAILAATDPYAETTQSSNLRHIQSTILPRYRAQNDIVEFNADYDVVPNLTLTSQTGYNNDYLWSTEDYNRFDTTPGIFGPDYTSEIMTGITDDHGVFCDPQLGCSDRLVAQDLSDETASQFSQEVRLASNYSGPFNFSVGGNYMHYQTEENYYVFINALTLYALSSFQYSPSTYEPGVTDNHECLYKAVYGFQPLDPRIHHSTPALNQCNYIDPNPIGKLNNLGHNYFLSQNPYLLNSYAAFGEAYYNILPDLKFTAGLRFTEDQKTFYDIPSEVVTDGAGYFETGVVKQKWDRLTGRAVLNWTPKLDFTDQTLLYASYAHGYKAGGANPPGAALLGFTNTGDIGFPDHPLTFKPEYIEAFELGTKNTLLDGALTFNGDVFYYNYTGYQISEIVDRTAINNNYDAHVEGAEIESNWEPLPGLRFNFAGGWEMTAAAPRDSGVDLMDRTAGNPDWMVVKPFPTQASNCILPTYVVAALLQTPGTVAVVTALSVACGFSYNVGDDPVTQLPYVPNPSSPPTFPAGYIGFNPATAPNNGEGFSKNLGGHELPNAPPFTLSVGGQYTLPIVQDWAATARADFYLQADSWARIFNDNPYDRIRSYSNLNLTLILTSDNGWQVMGYAKNVFNTTAITGDFLNSDDSGLTTNVFLTDPRLFGVRLTKNF